MIEKAKKFGAVLVIGILAYWLVTTFLMTVPEATPGMPVFADPLQAIPGSGAAPATTVGGAERAIVTNCDTCPENVYRVRLLGEDRVAGETEFYFYAAPTQPESTENGNGNANTVSDIAEQITDFVEANSWVQLLIIVLMFGWIPAYAWFQANRDMALPLRAQKPENEDFRVEDIAAYGPEIDAVKGAFSARIAYEDARRYKAFLELSRKGHGIVSGLNRMLNRTDPEKSWQEAVKLVQKDIATWLNDMIKLFHDSNPNEELNPDKLGRYLIGKAKNFKANGLNISPNIGLELIDVQILGVNLSQRQEDVANLDHETNTLIDNLTKFAERMNLQPSEAAKLFAQVQRALRGNIIFPESGVLGNIDLSKLMGRQDNHGNQTNMSEEVEDNE